MLYGILLALIVIVSLFLVIFVLMQSDKGGGLAGTFGGIGGGMPFSGREAATILSKLTTGLAIAFMVICIALALIRREQASTATSNSTLQKRAEQMKRQQASSPASLLPEPGAPESPIPQGGVPSPVPPPTSPEQQGGAAQPKPLF